MDNTSQNGSAGSANNSSDFVRPYAVVAHQFPPELIYYFCFLGAEIIQVCPTTRAGKSETAYRPCKRDTDGCHRMLEDPSYSSVVRWGDEMDSFVVLEVTDRGCPSSPCCPKLTD